jgi:site-specific recombinase XerD
VWGEVGKQDVQEWIAWLPGRYSAAYASDQFRALQQFFKWLAGEEGIPDPMAGLRPPRVPDKPVPVFAGDELPRLGRACAGRGFGERRDAAVIAVLEATGIRLSELAGIRYDPAGQRRSDVDHLWRREMTVHGKGGTTRVVKIGHDVARGLNRYIRVRTTHAQAYRSQLWLGVSNRGPMSHRYLPGRRPPRPPVRRRGVPAPVPPSLQPHLAGPRRGGGRPDGAEPLDVPPDAPP